MSLYPLDNVRNADIDWSLEPALESLREEVTRFCWPSESGIAAADAVGVFDASRPRLNVLMSLVRESGLKSGADIGAGFGFLPALLQSMGSTITATDCGDDVGAYARSRNVRTLEYCIGRDAPPFQKNSLDFIVFSEVLEHLRLAPAPVYIELSSMLRPGGRILTSTPNIARRQHIEALVSGDNFLEPLPEEVPWGEDATVAWEHVREYSVREVVEAIEAAGLEIETVLMTGWGEAGYRLLPNPYANEIIVVSARK